MALICWVLRKTNLTEVFLVIRSTNVSLFLAALLVYLASYYLRAYRWHTLLQTRGIRPSISYLFKSYMVGIFFNNFLPSTIGGDVVRVHDIWRLEPNKSIATITVFLDRLLGLFALMLFATGALLASQELIIKFSGLYPWIFSGILGITVVFGVTFIPLQGVSQFAARSRLSFWMKLQHKLSNLFKELLIFREHKNALAQALGWALIVQIVVVSHFYLISKSLGLYIPFCTFLLIVPLATLIMMLPISINAIGLRENAFVFLFGIYSADISRSETIAFTWVAYSIVLFQGFLGGIIYAFRR